MNVDNRLIKNSFKGLFTVNAVSLISVMICMIIDSVITGQFLGAQALTASGLLAPIVLLCTMVSGIFGSGLGILCTRYMGMANIKKVNSAFSIVIIATVTIGVIVSITLFFVSPILAGALSANADSEQIRGYIQDYLRGYSIGVVFASSNAALAGLMMLDNDKNRAVRSTFTVLVVDVVLDLANVLVFHGGMFGMALATSISAMCGFAVMIMHFRKKGHIIHFTREGLHSSDLKEAFLSGFSGNLNQMLNVIRGLVFSQFLLKFVSGSAVAALAIANNSFNLVIAVFLAMFLSTTTLCSMMYGEGDKNSLTRALAVAIKYMLIIAVIVCGIFFIFSNQIALLFLKGGEAEALSQASLFIKFMAAQYFLNALSYPVAGGFMGVRQFKFNYLVSILREGVFPIASVLLLGLSFGIVGVEMGFVLSGIFTLAAAFIIPGILNREFPKSASGFMVMPKGFGVSDDEMIEGSLKDMDDVIKMSEQARRFCLSKGSDSKTALLCSLFIEEMAGNTVMHCFSGKGNNSIDVRLIYKDGYIIRLRDNGIPFDPVKWLEKNHSEDKSSGIGIRMIIGMAKDVQYIPALQMNNMIVTI